MRPGSGLRSAFSAAAAALQKHTDQHSPPSELVPGLALAKPQTSRAPDLVGGTASTPCRHRAGQALDPGMQHRLMAWQAAHSVAQEALTHCRAEASHLIGQAAAAGP